MLTVLVKRDSGDYALWLLVSLMYATTAATGMPMALLRTIRSLLAARHLMAYCPGTDPHIRHNDR